jgi:hypothetical protein
VPAKVNVHAGDGLPLRREQADKAVAYEAGTADDED